MKPRSDLSPETIREFAIDRKARLDELESVLEGLRELDAPRELLKAIKQRRAVRSEQAIAYRRRYETNLSVAREAAESSPSDYQVNTHG